MRALERAHPNAMLGLASRFRRRDPYERKLADVILSAVARKTSNFAQSLVVKLA